MCIAYITHTMHHKMQVGTKLRQAITCNVDNGIWISATFMYLHDNIFKTYNLKLKCNCIFFKRSLIILRCSVSISLNHMSIVGIPMHIHFIP